MIPFFLVVIFLVIIVAFATRKNTKAEQDLQKQFFEQERLANSTRRKDVSQLPYLIIPLETFPLGVHTDEQLQSLETKLRALADEKILNLNGQTNTDLKMKYGIANLEFLSQCDENYIRLVTTVTNYGKQLAELSYSDDAVTVLEYGITCGSDITNNYTLLVDLYRQTGQNEKISSLLAAAEALDSPRKDLILKKLSS